MGIGGLLLHTKSIGVWKHISSYAGLSVGIDGYSWLHKALHTCAADIALDNNIEKMITYF